MLLYVIIHIILAVRLTSDVSCWFSVVKVALAGTASVSGGGLPNSTYQSLQFHLHWGNGSAVPGSEHTVNGKRYPMEVERPHRGLPAAPWALPSCFHVSHQKK